MKPEITSFSSPGRFLEGMAVGISVAHGEDSAKRGFTEDEMNHSAVRVADGLLGAGARLVFGHDWRPNGVMAAVADLAVRYERATPLTDSASMPELCRITNLVPWDRRAELPEDLRKDLEARGILRVIEVPLPARLGDRESHLGKRTLRAAALSHLRQRLAELCEARVCLGGKFQKFEGFWPGIFEEAWTGAIRRQPVFLSEMLGGAAGRVLESARTGEWNNFITPPADEELHRGLEKMREFPVVPLPDFRELQMTMNWARLQTQSWLAPEDWQQLTTARDIEVVTTLVLKGLRRARAAE